MKHAVSMVAYNRTPEQLALTKEAVNSILAQDIGELDILLVDNGSTDGTREYFESLKRLPGPHRIRVGVSDVNLSPCVVFNRCLKDWFGPIWSAEKVLCVANDVILPPNFYRLLNEWPVGVVTASMTDTRDFTRMEKASAVSANIPMAVGLLRKPAYDAVVNAYGYWLDEGFFFYASDCDLALRLCACGIRGVQLDLQYFHSGSAHWRMLPPEEGAKETAKADVDRQYFVRKWGFGVSDQAYVDAAHDLNFRGERKDR